MNANTIVGFQTGRGGSFNNPGYVTFLGECKISDFTESLFLSYENENKILKELGNRDNLVSKFESCRDNDDFSFFEKLGFDFGEKIYISCSGVEVGLTEKECDSGVGTIDIDGGYDTVSTCLLGDLDADSIELIERSGVWNKNDFIKFIESK